MTQTKLGLIILGVLKDFVLFCVLLNFWLSLIQSHVY